MGTDRTRGEPWEGGYIHQTKTGRQVYRIYRRVGGRLYEVSTRCSTLRGAMAELARWELDPDGYEPGGPAKAEPVFLNSKLAEEFLAYSSEQKGNSPRWVGEQAKHMEWWRGHLKGVDLRGAPIAKIEGPLKNAPSRQHRIIVIKSLYSWLIGVKRLLEPTEDPTFRVLKVPQARPASKRGKKKAYSRDEYMSFRAQLVELSEQRGKGGQRLFAPRWIDALDVLAGTGWHVTELARFSKDGAILSAPRSGEGAGVLEMAHKSGAVHRTVVGDQVLEAAKRIRAHGDFRPDALRTAIQRACDRLGLTENFRPGSMRHSVATHAVDAGGDLAATSDFLGHQSEETTKTFYATHATPRKVPTIL